MVSVIPSYCMGEIKETTSAFICWPEKQEAEFPLKDYSNGSRQTNLASSGKSCVAADAVLSTVPVKIPSRSGCIDFMLSQGDAYPDSQTSYDLIMADYTLNYAHWICTGTHVAALRSHKSTGEKLNLTGTLANRFGNREIVENREVIGRSEWFQQLGAIDRSVSL